MSELAEILWVLAIQAGIFQVIRIGIILQEFWMSASGKSVDHNLK